MVLVKRYFLTSLSAFLSQNKTDLIPYILFTGKMSHLVSIMRWRSYWLWRFQAGVKMLFNWKTNPSILEEIKSKCSRKIELQEVIMKYKGVSPLWHTYTHISPRHFNLLLRDRKPETEDQSGIIQNHIMISPCVPTLLKMPGIILEYY